MSKQYFTCGEVVRHKVTKQKAVILSPDKTIEMLGDHMWVEFSEGDKIFVDTSAYEKVPQKKEGKKP